MSLPGISQLEATPEILRLLMGGLTGQDTQWKAAPERFAHGGPLSGDLLRDLPCVHPHKRRRRCEGALETIKCTLVDVEDAVVIAQHRREGAPRLRVHRNQVRQERQQEAPDQ